MSVDLEDTAAIRAVICDLEFLAKLVEQEDICYPPRVKVHRSISKIRLLISLQSAFVAVNANRVCGRADVSDVIGVREEMNCRLADEKEEVGANGTTSAISCQRAQKSIPKL